jgi:hypothetical protein
VGGERRTYGQVIDSVAIGLVLQVALAFYPSVKRKLA